MSYDPKDRTFRQTVCLAINAERTTGAVKNELFWHCRRCISEKDGDLKAGLELFLSRCKEQEEWVLSKDSGPMHCDKMPDLWMQGKSDCKRAIEMGIDPREWESYSKMKGQKLEAAKAKREGSKATRPERDGKADTSLADALADGTVVDSKNTTLCPDDLLPVVALIAPLPELSRVRTINRLIEVASSARKDHDRNISEGQRRQA